MTKQTLNWNLGFRFNRRLVVRYTRLRTWIQVILIADGPVSWSTSNQRPHAKFDIGLPMMYCIVNRYPPQLNIDQRQATFESTGSS